MATSLPVLEDVEPLPLLYQRWLTEFFGGPIPRERNATCHNCAMCREADREPRAPETSFNPSTKCCTYIPEVYNFLVGAALADDDPAARSGRTSLEARIHGGVATTPLSLGMPASFEVVYDSDKRLFGRAESLLCPHFVNDHGGQCGIWKYRNSVCSTYFCKHVRGEVGSLFWRDVRDLLSTVEQELSVWCLLELGVDTELVGRLIANRGTSPNTRLGAELVSARREQHRREAWGVWYGREIEFYLACADRVSRLSWDDVCAIGGPITRARRERLLCSYEDLASNVLPPRLETAPQSRRRAAPGSAQIHVSTYSSTDTLWLSSDLLSVLHHFDGRSTSRILAEVEEAEGVVLEAPLIRRLVDFRVLREPDSRPREIVV